MSMTIQQIRQQYPQYKNKSDEELANAMHQKFYAHIPKEEFFNKIGYSPSVGLKTEEEAPSALVRYPMAIAQGMAQTGQNLGKFLGTGALRKAFGMPEEKPVDFRKALGYQYQPSGFEKLTELAAEEAPGFLMPETKLFGAVEKLKSVPKVGKYLSELAAKGVPYAEYKATQEESPVKGFAKGLGEYAAGLGAVKGLGALKETGKLALRPVDVEKTYEGIQDSYNAANKKLGNLFEFVTKQAKERGVENVGKIDDTFMEDAKNLLPSTKVNRILINNAGEGNYDSIRKLYTKIGRYRRKTSEFETAELYDDLRDRINESLKNHFINTGNKDLSQWLDAAKSGYSQLKKTYESTPMLRKLVGESQEIPETLKPLKKKNTEMARIRALHPEIEKDIAAQNIKKAIKAAGAFGLAYKGAKSLFHNT